MQIELDGATLELEAKPGVLCVGVDKSGFDSSCLEVISRYVEVAETDTGLMLTYGLAEGELSFPEATRRAKTRLERLVLAQKLAVCAGYRGSFKVPLIHPENVYLNGGSLRVVHSGLQVMLAPMALDEARFLASLQAMVLQIFRPKLAFEQILDGATALRDKFSNAIRQTATVEELFAYIDGLVRAEQAEVQATQAIVSKRRYALYRVLGVVGLIAALAMGAVTWNAAAHSRLQGAVVAAQAKFLMSDYAGTLKELEDYEATALPASAKYVLAVSSINLYDLTTTQKQAILNNVSEKSDDVTLKYWIAIGRGDFEQALDYAKNLGDDQLTLLSYTDLYQATKLDSKMPGGKKQELLDEYTKAIDELTAKLDGTGEEAAQE